MPSRPTFTKLAGAFILILVIGWGIWYKTRSPIFLDDSSPAENQSSVDSKKTAEAAGLQVQEADLSVAKSADSPKLKLLKEILLTKNDNDPRLDSEFTSLSPELKQELKQLYHDLPKESLNQRGTVLFVLAKDLSRTQDLEIFGVALTEEACLSFANCSQSPNESPDDHLDSVNEVSLLYPQMVALNRLENLIHKADFFSHTDDYIREVREILQKATLSKEPRIQQKAENLLEIVLRRKK
jgi:hypothetical protein